MKKINMTYIMTIIKDALTKACIYFTLITLILTATAIFFNLMLNQGTYFMFALAALGAGLTVQIFKIERLPLASRHIAFFILLYLDFLLVIIPLSQHTVSSNTTLLLSVAFTVIYLVIFGIVLGIKAIINSVRNKKSNYEKQFKNIE